MKETGIIMSGGHPKLILDGIKTMARRVMKPQPKYIEYMQGIYWKKGNMVYSLPNQGAFDDRLLGIWEACPYGQVGDRLIIKEAWATERKFDHLKPSEIPLTAAIYYVCDYPNGMVNTGRKRSARFMCNWMSRNRPEITEVRAERVQRITEGDARAEGVRCYEDILHLPPTISISSYILAEFVSLWDSLNAKRGYGWALNPWVWTISFRRVD